MKQMCAAHSHYALQHPGLSIWGSSGGHPHAGRPIPNAGVSEAPGNQHRTNHNRLQPERLCQALPGPAWLQPDHHCLATPVAPAFPVALRGVTSGIAPAPWILINLHFILASMRLGTYTHRMYLGRWSLPSSQPGQAVSGTPATPVC